MACARNAQKGPSQCFRLGVFRVCGYRSPSRQARDRPGRRKPAAKMAARQICRRAQRVGRARSPLRAGVARADPVFRLESGFPRPYGRGYAQLAVL